MLDPSHLTVLKAELITYNSLNIIYFIPSFMSSNLDSRIGTLRAILKCPLLLKLHHILTLVYCVRFVVFSLEILLVG